jgi:hypothetical protein
MLHRFDAFSDNGHIQRFGDINKRAYDALEFLENEWPLKHGTYHERAISRCRGALQELVSANTALEAFVDACLEAGMPPTESNAGAVPPRIDLTVSQGH